MGMNSSVVIELGLPFVLSLVVSALLTFVIIRLSHASRVLLPAHEERWHKQPKPFLGGIAIYVAFISGMLIFGADEGKMRTILFCSTAMFLIGLLDDLFDLKAYIKFIYQIALASIVAKLGITVAVVQDPILAMTISVFWIVTITNAFNLMDNMDGLSSGTAIIAMASFLALEILIGASTISLPAAILIGALCGFLIFNFPPARIFMGDCGALFVGFLLAVYSIQGTWYQASNLLVLLITPVLFLGVPLFDTIIVSVQRILNGKPIYVGGKDHSSHRLVAHGLSETKAILILYGLSILFALTAIIGYHLSKFVLTQMVLIFLAVLFVFGAFLSEVKVYHQQDDDEQDEAPAKRRSFQLAIPYMLHKRRVVEVIIDALLIVVAYFGAYLLRYEGWIPGHEWITIQQSLPLVIPIKLIGLLLGGLYSGVWKYIDFSDFRRILQSTIFATLLSVAVLVAFYRFEGYSRAVFIIDYVLLLMLIVGARLLMRVLRETFYYGFSKKGRPVLIIGAGEAGQWVINEIRKERTLDLKPIGIVDDDPWKLGRKLYAIPVVGNSKKLPALIMKYQVDEVILAIPSLTEERRQELIELCSSSKVVLRILDSITNWSFVAPGETVPSRGDRDFDSTRSDSSSDLSTPSDSDRRH